MIYLDNAATTYPKPESVYKAMDFAQRNFSFNAGRGAYKQSRDCANVLDEARKELASICNADYRDVTLLSSATEALNLIINGLQLHDGSNVYITPFEHNAIIRPLYNIKRIININIHILPFNKVTWEPEINKIENMFALNNPDVVFSSQISNVVGLMINYVPIFQMAKKYNSVTVLDAAQGYGVVPVKTKDIDFLVFAGHKSLSGPFGIGGFINLKTRKLNVVKSGGTGSDTLNHFMPESGHERYESGSFNVPAAYALIEGVKWVKNNNIKEQEIELTQYLINSLKKLNKVNLYLPSNEEKVIGIVSISVDGYSADEIGNILSDEFNICIRTGYHCSPLVHEFINSTINGGTARISISGNSNVSDIDALISALKTL